MATYHIHIKGQVQGVGFRPFVYQKAEELGIHGWVSNSNDGVHVEFNATPGTAAAFYHHIISSPPPHAILTHHHIREVAARTYTSFYIKESNARCKPTLLLTPDIAICEDCKAEVLQAGNRWTGYPFTTCLHCGPRYSIITHLPYDRAATTMAPLPLCKHCSAEYSDVFNRRHYSQTISCSRCAIPMHLYTTGGAELLTDNTNIIPYVSELLKKGNIIAVKGVGGYLLLCDATNALSLAILRKRKHRPSKPFALLYPDLARARWDAEVQGFEEDALLDPSAPIVLCKLKAPNRICSDLIAPGLSRVGVMLPYTPLLLLLATAFGKPLIATSGNISGSPIIYKDSDALEHLSGVADYLLTYDRDIVAPQDDSVLQFTASGQKIILRRSRGLAPTYHPNPFNYTNEAVLAMGGELKAAFALLNHTNLYVSQFLGDQQSIEAQDAYQSTVNHMLQVLQTKAARILVDSHPGYFVSALGREMAERQHIPINSIQHHKAHFGAVLAENHLLQSTDPVLGVIWDGTGYGEDAQVWGGEFFLFKEAEMHRVAHLDYFPQLLGDKMSKEPRLSALSLLKDLPTQRAALKGQFSEQEWSYYPKCLQEAEPLWTSSMGRFLDGVAAILGICSINTYEGEAAMRLEAQASRYRTHAFEPYTLPLRGNQLEFTGLLLDMFNDLEHGEDTGFIAWKVFCSLANAIDSVREQLAVRKIAFSGGVFQNALLTDLVIQLLSQKAELYFHHQLSPNDECIGFGQLACYELIKKKVQTTVSKKPAAARVEIL